MIDAETIRCWRINYGLDTRTPEEAMRWWSTHRDGMAPAGAVAALGLCLQERDRLRSALLSARAWIEADRQSLVSASTIAGEPATDHLDRAALEQYDALLAEIDAALGEAK